MRPTLTPVAFIFIILLMGVLAVENYLVIQAGPAARGIALEGLDFENTGSLFSQQHTGVWPGDALGNFKNPYAD